MKSVYFLGFSTACAALIFSGCAASSQSQCEEQLLAAQKRLTKPSIAQEQLEQKTAQFAAQISANLKEQKSGFAEFENFLRWMSGSLTGYEKALHTSAQIAAVTKFLPIPYAGQASGFAKFAANFTLQLSNAGGALQKMQDAAQKYQKLLGEYEANPTSANLSNCIKFADETLVPTIHDTAEKLEKIGQMSASMLGFLGAIDGYLQNADEMLGRAKSLLGGDVTADRAQMQQKSGLLRSKLDIFDKRCKALQELAKKESQLAKNAQFLIQLSSQLSPTMAAK